MQTLRSLGLLPDIVCVRSSLSLSDKTIEKLSNICQVDQNNVFLNPDVDNIYEIPVLFHKNGMYSILQQKLHLDDRPTTWVGPVINNNNIIIKVGIVGRFFS